MNIPATIEIDEEEKRAYLIIETRAFNGRVRVLSGIVQDKVVDIPGVGVFESGQSVQLEIST